MSLRRSSRPDTRTEPAQEPRIPLLYWLIVGGTGPPPTKVNFRRMVSERNAAYREEKAYQKARKAASAEFKAKWLAMGLGGSKKQQRLGRKELIRLYGSGGTAQRQTQDEGTNHGGGNEDHGRNGNDIDGINDDNTRNNGDNSAN
ncbi:hypothetical protein GGR51DRAFT_563979 [Nemania sp. FL0031]|nr:hypothetical protein GGR51DRAFT_563979 [Nemania sp. FL0031]